MYLRIKHNNFYYRIDFFSFLPYWFCTYRNIVMVDTNITLTAFNMLYHKKMNLYPNIEILKLKMSDLKLHFRHSTMFHAKYA